jgi:serpin B
MSFLRFLKLYGIILLSIVAELSALEPEEVGYRLAAQDKVYGLKLFQQLPGKVDQNKTVSPYGYRLSLSFVSAGARGDTLRDFANEGEFQFSFRDIHPGYQQLDRLLASDAHQSLEMGKALALWVPMSVKVEPKAVSYLKQHYKKPPDFLNRTVDYYGGGINSLDFVNSPDGAVAAMDSWVRAQTAESLGGFLTEKDIQPSTSMIFTGFFSFKPKWQYQWQSSGYMDFNVLRLERRKKKKEIHISTMETTGKYFYASIKGLELVEIPLYKRQYFALLVKPPVLNLEAMEEFETQLTDRNLSLWQEKMIPELVRVRIPRFKIQNHYELAGVSRFPRLKFVGKENHPDFTGFTQGMPPGTVWMSYFFHGSQFMVDEKGMESPPPVEDEAKQFVADSLFYILLYHRETEELLWVGRVLKPEPSGSVARAVIAKVHTEISADCAKWPEMLKGCTPHRCYYNHPVTGESLIRELRSSSEGCEMIENLPGRNRMRCVLDEEMRLDFSRYYGLPKGTPEDNPVQYAVDSGACEIQELDSFWKSGE